MPAFLAVLEKTRQCVYMTDQVAKCAGNRRAIAAELCRELLFGPLIKLLGHGCCAGLSDRESRRGRCVSRETIDFEQLVDERDRDMRARFIGADAVDKIASRVGPTGDLRRSSGIAVERVVHAPLCLAV